MRVAIVTTSYPSNTEDPSGHFVRCEAVRWACEGHDVHVIAPAADRPLIPCDSAMVQQWRISHAGAFGWPGASVRLKQHPHRVIGAAWFAAKASRTLRLLRPDHVIAHWIVPCAWPIVSPVIGHASFEVVVHGADVRLLCLMPAPLKRIILHNVLERASSMRVVSSSLLRALRQGLNGVTQAQLDAKAVVRAASIDVSHPTSRARFLRAQCDARIMASVVGRLISSKRVDLAIGATKMLRGQVHLQVVGDGPEESRLRDLAQGQRVSFLGRVARDEALAWIAASDVLIHPSGAEGAPTVVREARALGTPVVACDAGDLVAWADCDTGIRIVDPSAEAIARAVGCVTCVACCA